MYLDFTVIYPTAIDILTRHLIFAFQLVLFKYVILYPKWRGNCGQQGISQLSLWALLDEQPVLGPLKEKSPTK